MEARLRRSSAPLEHLWPKRTHRQTLTVTLTWKTTMQRCGKHLMTNTMVMMGVGKTCD